jgi:hypothetical protein
MSYELRSPIRNNRLGNTMKTYHLLKVNVSIHVRVIVRLDRNKMSGFGQMIYDNPDESKPFSVVGNPTMKSITISSHFQPGIESGCNKIGFM